MKWCLELGVQEVTIFAFSIENFKRSREEVDTLMNIAEEKLQELMNQECVNINCSVVRINNGSLGILYEIIDSGFLEM